MLRIRARPVLSFDSSRSFDVFSLLFVFYFEMEKNDCDSNQTSDDEGEVEAKQAETNRILLSSSALTDLIPHSILLSCDAGLSNE